MRLLEILRRFVDPAGPAGEVISPADVYKTRLGLPIESPHRQRVVLQAPGHLEQTLAPVRFVALSEATDVPRSRVRQVSAFVEEYWSPVYEKTASTDMATIL